MSKTVLALALLSVCTLANAHFGSVIPDKQIVSDPKDSTLTITAAFNHPMEQAQQQPSLHTSDKRDEAN